MSPTEKTELIDCARSWFFDMGCTLDEALEDLTDEEQMIVRSQWALWEASQ